MSHLRSAELSGRDEMMSTDNADDDERVAETWILAGGSWKKRQEAAAIASAAATVSPSTTNNTKTSASPFRNRSPGKLQHPRASSRNQASSQRPTSNGSSPPTLESSFPIDAGSTTSRTLSRDDSFRSRSSDGKTSRSASSGRICSNDITSPFLRMSSGLSSGVSSKASNDTKRSTRTSQTEPTRLHSTLNNSTAVSGSASITSHIPEVVVEGKKRRISNKKTNTSWLQEKDSFFSATRHSESVKNPIENRRSSSTQNRRPSLDTSTFRSSQKEESRSSRTIMDKEARSSEGTSSSCSSSKEQTIASPKQHETRHVSEFLLAPKIVGTSRPSSRGRSTVKNPISSKVATTNGSSLVRSSDQEECQISSPNASQKNESFNTVQTSNTSNRDALSETMPSRKKHEARCPRNSTRKNKQQEDKILEGWATDWSDEKKESKTPLDPHVVEAFRDTRAIDVLAIDTKPDTKPRNGRSDPTMPRTSNPPPLDQPTVARFSSMREDSARSPDTVKNKPSHRHVKAHSQESKVRVLTAKDLLAEEKMRPDSTEENMGIPRSHARVIRQCFGFDCDIYKDVLEVGRNATDRQLRIACFRRCRSVLAEHDQRVQSSKDITPESVLKILSNETREKCRAISLAYEILDKPEWRSLYDKHGWDAPMNDATVKKSVVPVKGSLRNNISPPPRTARASIQQRSSTVEPRSRSTTPILRSVASDDDERRSRSSGRGIRWSEQVEELVFRQDPEELEARRLRSPPPPDPSIFDEEWMPENMEDAEPSFMANILSEFDQSLDGLEESLDGFMKRGLEDWSISSKGSKSTQSEKIHTKTEFRDSKSPISEVSSPSDGAEYENEDDTLDDTVPSKLTETVLGPSTELESRSPDTEEWNGAGSIASTIPSTIQPEEDSEDSAVKQLFKALTHTSDDRKKREDPCNEHIFKIVKQKGSDEVKKTKEPCDGRNPDRSSPSDVRTIPTEEDEVTRAFSSLKQDYRITVSRLETDTDIFDPFEAEDEVVTLNICDGDFDSSASGFKDLASKLNERDSPKEQRRVSKEFPVFVEDIASVSSSPDRAVEATTQRRPDASAPITRMFSQPVPEFQEANNRIPLRTQIVDTTDFRRAKSDFSSLSGTTSTFNNSVDHGLTINADHQRSRSPALNDTIQPAVLAGMTNDGGEKSSVPPCDMDFLSNLFCYSNALSGDLKAFSSDFSSKIAATRNMILESLTLTDDDVRSVVSAMDLPHVERSNTI